MEKLAIVILNYNGRHFLQKFLPNVIKHASGFSIYVADNASNDRSVEFLRANFPSVILIEFDKNFGYSEGYNRALSQIRSDYCMLLNSDVEVSPNWLDPLIQLMDQNPNIAACQPKLLAYHRKEYFEYAGAAGGFIDRYGYPFCRGRIFRTMERDYGQYDNTIPIFWASGACMMVRLNVFQALGGFDPDFFAHMEEIDLCWRMKLAGHEIYYCGESYIYHVGGGTLNESDPYKTYLNFRNSLITLLKNARRKVLVVRLMIRLLFDLIAALKFLISGSLGDSKAVIQANFHIYHRFRYYMRKRDIVNRTKKYISNVYPYSIVLSYYFFRKKFFFNLSSVIPNPVVSSTKPFPKIHRESQGEVQDYRRSKSKEGSINEKNSDT